MAEFKKISDVDVLTDLTENDNVLVIGSDGALKQTASSNVKGSTSWNDLTDKPFGEEPDGIIKKIDEKYLPDMNSSGSCGIEYWTGEVTWDSESNMFTLQGLELSTGEEVEIGIKLNGSSNAPCCVKYSFISGITNNGISMYSLEYANNTSYPSARLREVSNDSGYDNQLYLTSSTETDAVSMFNPQILFVRVYRMA